MIRVSPILASDRLVTIPLHMSANNLRPRQRMVAACEQDRTDALNYMIYQKVTILRPVTRTEEGPKTGAS
jgi:hypothetical protein